MGAKERVNDVLRRFVVVGVVVDLIWRWRKLLYWGIAGVVTWRVLYLGIFITVTVLAALTPARVEAAGSYPGSGRNEDEWYYCYASRQASGGVWAAWSDMVCEHLQWNDTPGVYHSQNFELGVSEAGAAPVGAEVVGYIIAPAGVKIYNYHCEGVVARTFLNGTSGSSTAIANTTGTASNPFNGDDTEFSFGYPSNVAANATFATDFDVQGLWRASQQDNFSSLEPVTTWATTESTYPHFKVSATLDSTVREVSAFLSCYINGLTMWGVLEPWTPSPGDLIPGPEATATPGENDWSFEPWIPITNPINAPDFSLGPGEDGGCEMIIPEQSFEYEGLDYGWYGFEVCRTDYDLELTFMNNDLSSYINIALMIGGVAILFGIIKRP